MRRDLREAIEVAAAAMWADVDAYAAENNIDHDPVAWEHAPQDHAKECRDAARVVIEAAAPIIRAQVAEEIARAIEALAKDAAKTDSPDAILGLIAAAQIARGYTQAGQEPADRQEQV